jgi:hypothetical protein
LSQKRRFAASELGVAVLNALDEEVSSFAMEGAFLNAWLTYAFRRMRVPTDEAERLRRTFGTETKEILALLEQICGDLPLLQVRLPAKRKSVKGRNVQITYKTARLFCLWKISY